MIRYDYNRQPKKALRIAAFRAFYELERNYDLTFMPHVQNGAFDAADFNCRFQGSRSVVTWHNFVIGHILHVPPHYSSHLPNGGYILSLQFESGWHPYTSHTHKCHFTGRPEPHHIMQGVESLLAEHAKDAAETRDTYEMELEKADVTTKSTMYDPLEHHPQYHDAREARREARAVQLIFYRFYTAFHIMTEPDISWTLRRWKEHNINQSYEPKRLRLTKTGKRP